MFFKMIEEAVKFIENNAEYTLLAVFIIFLLFLIFSISALIISVKANRKMKRILRSNKGRDITEAIMNYYDKCKEIEDNFEISKEKIKALETEMKSCIKKVGALRYNAFGENNTNLSYVTALLDESDSGFVLNGVCTRESSTSYLKPIKNGKSIFALSDEEQEAINLAKENYNKNLLSL